ncbi:MAG: autotransporter outer membrane beta-barrel domain-containing protein, partial [Alphaproteobacteria bacterium]|nr:autotransporter outer membrane beta-barrel domain-containing protein [Alphaproteobacteria bacterium]
GMRVGAAGGYDHTAVSTFNGVNANSQTNTMRFALYGSQQFEDAVTLDMQVGYARHMMDGDRFETNNGATARNSHLANEVSSGFQVSKTFDVHGFRVKPKLGMNYAHVEEDGYTETDAGLFNATIASKSINSLRLSTGIGVSKRMTGLNGLAFTPEARIKYSYEAWDSSVATTGSQRGIGFSSNGLAPSRHILSVGTGFSANLDDAWSAFGNYDVDMPTGNSFEQTFTAGLRMNF